MRPQPPPPPPTMTTRWLERRRTPAVPVEADAGHPSGGASPPTRRRRWPERRRTMAVPALSPWRRLSTDEEEVAGAEEDGGRPHVLPVVAPLSHPPPHNSDNDDERRRRRDELRRQLGFRFFSLFLFCFLDFFFSRVCDRSIRTRKSDFSRSGAPPAQRNQIFANTFRQTNATSTRKNSFCPHRKIVFVGVRYLMKNRRHRTIFCSLQLILECRSIFQLHFALWSVGTSLRKKILFTREKAVTLLI